MKYSPKYMAAARRRRESAAQWRRELQVLQVAFQLSKAPAFLPVSQMHRELLAECSVKLSPTTLWNVL